MRRVGAVRGGGGVALALGVVGLLSCTRTRITEWKVSVAGEAKEALANVRFEDEDSIDRVAALRHTADGLRVAREALAAVWIHAASADPALIQSWLGDPEASIRLMAAAELVGRGDASGFDPLLKLLSVEERLKGSRPPGTVKAFAASTLARFTGEKRSTAWPDWLEKNRAKLRFDPELGTWSAP
jgi:hypothetical protein